MFRYQPFSFLLLIGVLRSACVSSIIIPTIPTSPMENLIANIVSNFTLKFIPRETTFISIRSASSTRVHDRLHHDIISDFIMLNHATFTYRIIGPDIQFGTRHTFYLFLIETYDNFINVLSSINQKVTRTDQYYLTIVTSTNNNYTFLNDLFIACYDKSVTRMNFLLQQSQSGWLMTTFKPFVKSCNSLQQHDIAMLTEQNYSLNGPLKGRIYPRKLKDLRQCPLIAAVSHTPPFIIITSQKVGNVTEIVYDGIETRIIEQVAKQRNFKLTYRMAADNQKRGVIYPNGTITGCIKMVVEKEANFTLGALRTTPSRDRYMRSSITYMPVSLGFAVLPSEDISTAIERLLAPFSPVLWYSTVVCIGLAVIIISFTKKLTRRQRHFIIGGYLNSTPILNMWNAFLGGGMGNPLFAKARYLSTFARFLLMTWLISCLVLRGSYQGALYDFLQRERLTSPYDTIAKINKSGCNVLIMSTAAATLDLFYFGNHRYLLYNYDNYSQFEVFHKVYDRELSGPVYCNDLQMKHFNLLNSPHRVLQMTKDRLFLMDVVIYFNNNSVLRPIFNQEISALVNNGLIDYWTRSYVDERTLSSRFTQRIPTKLNLKSVYAIFQISFGLLVLCCFVFVLEKLTTRFLWLKRIVDSITY